MYATEFPDSVSAGDIAVKLRLNNSIVRVVGRPKDMEKRGIADHYWEGNNQCDTSNLVEVGTYPHLRV